MAETSERRPVIIPDILKDNNIQYPEKAAKEGIKAILGVPIVFLNEVLGSLRLYHYDIWKVSEQDIDSLHLLAENIALAMTYTRLLNAVQTVSEVINYALPAQMLPEVK